uniref:hypothetical protein n=1 Tax=uncultured Rhizobium sp. TaxID=155567 RepID=UPI0026362923|nr:hypothetical protein [uncultured Rhizobium sp.]
MHSNDIIIEKFWLKHMPGAQSDGIAIFNARVGDFRVVGGKIRRMHADGDLYIAVPGRPVGVRGAISLPRESKTRRALEVAVFEKLKDAAYGAR